MQTTARKLTALALAGLAAACAPKFDPRIALLERSIAPAQIAEAARISRLTDAEVAAELARVPDDDEAAPAR
jgi:hypothetical protein